MYRADDDPWRLAERWYEQRKYSLTLAALPAARYRRAFEPGCSVGVLSGYLAERCDELVSWGRATAAVRQAAARLERHPRASARLGTVPGQWPEGSFDLIVLSEMLYYLGTDDLIRTARTTTGSLGQGGHLVAVHWRHPVPEHTQSAERTSSSSLRPLRPGGLRRPAVRRRPRFRRGARRARVGRVTPSRNPVRGAASARLNQSIHGGGEDVRVRRFPSRHRPSRSVLPLTAQLEMRRLAGAQRL